MMVIVFIPITLILFAGLMLWGWIEGESKNIRWLRHWCAPLFVMTAMLISAGAGAGAALAISRGAITADVAQLLQRIEEKISAGQSHEVVKEIRATDHTDDPDRDAFDLLKHLTVMNENLAAKTDQVASGPGTAPK